MSDNLYECIDVPCPRSIHDSTAINDAGMSHRNNQLAPINIHKHSANGNEGSLPSSATVFCTALESMNMFGNIVFNRFNISHSVFAAPSAVHGETTRRLGTMQLQRNCYSLDCWRCIECGPQVMVFVSAGLESTAIHCYY